jgi:toxin CcdB
MAQFDVYPNPDPERADLFPYFVDIQNDLHAKLGVRVVIPLSRETSAIEHLMPVVDVKGEKLILSVPDLSSVPVSICIAPVVNLSRYRNEIVDALDFLLNGF